MNGDKSSISNADGYEEIGAFWDSHDLGEYVDETSPADFVVDIRSQSTYFAVDPALTKQLRARAAKRGVSAETLLNLWLKERMSREPIAR